MDMQNIRICTTQYSASNIVFMLLQHVDSAEPSVKAMCRVAGTDEDGLCHRGEESAVSCTMVSHATKRAVDDDQCLSDLGFACDRQHFMYISCKRKELI